MTGELTSDEIDDVLRTQCAGVLSVCDDTQPYAVPVTFAYDGQDIVGHTYTGKKTRIANGNPAVCFVVTDIVTMSQWRSVLCRGTFEHVQGADAVHAANTLLSHLSAQPQRSGIHLPLVADGRSHAARDERPGVFYRIRISERTGRFERYMPPKVTPLLDILLDVTSGA